MECGRSPLACQLRLSKRGWERYVDDGLLALDANYQLILLDIHDEVLALQVARNFDGDIEISNGLGPLVRERGLLLGLLGAGCRISNWIWLSFSCVSE
jgi:hypothetical protein